jgi:hypothetical protein
LGKGSEDDPVGMVLRAEFGSVAIFMSMKPKSTGGLIHEPPVL